MTSIFWKLHPTHVSTIIATTFKRSSRLKNRCSLKFRNIQRKTSMFKSHFNKVAGLQGSNFIKKRLKHRSIAKFLRTAFSQNTSDGCFFNEHTRTTILNFAWAICIIYLNRPLYRWIIFVVKVDLLNLM